VGRCQVGGVVWTGETGAAALDLGQNSRIVLQGQHRGTAVGTLFSLTARVGFVFFFCFCFLILMHTASIWTRLVGGEVFGSHAGGVLEEDKTENKTNRTEK